MTKTHDVQQRQVPISDLVVDQELRRLVPRPSQADRDALLESLKAGQKVPIMTTPDKRVLDGYIRLEMLKELRVERVFIQVVDGLVTREDELDYCLGVNVSRRHLNDFQKVELGRAMVEVQARREAAERAREGARAGGRAGGRGRRKAADSPPDARREGENRHEREASAKIARAVGLKSGRQYEKGAAVLEVASPKEVEDLRQGKATINAAYSRLRAAKKQTQAQELAASIDESSLGGQIMLGDGLVVGPEPGTVDLVVVDPPYGIAESDGFTLQGDTAIGVAETLPDWDKTCPRGVIAACLRRISELLKPTGSFYLFCDRRLITYAWDEAAKAGLLPRNTVHWIKTNPVPSGRRNWSSATEVALYGAKGKAFVWNLTGDAPNAISAPIVGGGERTAHPTQKPLSVIEKLIEASSNPGDLVVDFMAGSGTTGVAARQLKRRFVLVEREQRYVAIARARLAMMSGTNAEPHGDEVGQDPASPISADRRLDGGPLTADGQRPEYAPTTATAHDFQAAVSADSALEVAARQARASRQVHVGVVTGPNGYAALIDSAGEVLQCTPVPTSKRGACDPAGVADLVESWVKAGVVEVSLEAPPVDGRGEIASLRAGEDYGAWSGVLHARGVPHGPPPEGWRSGFRSDVQQAEAMFPDVDLRAVEKGSNVVSRTKARALLVARHLVMRSQATAQPLNEASQGG